MKTKGFFKHIGLAAGYLLFFMLLQGWVAALFSFGMMMGSIGHPASSAEMLDSIWQAADQILQFNDVIMLLFYVGCIAFYLCFLEKIFAFPIGGGKFNRVSVYLQRGRDGDVCLELVAEGFFQRAAEPVSLQPAQEPKIAQRYKGKQ